MNKKILLVILFLATLLRLWKINEIPVSLFGDELDVGYHAYSILKTGKDYYGNPLPIHFHSIAEWRTPLYLYSAVPTVAVFGITPLGVRLPAAVFGILSVLMMYLLVKEFLSYGVKPRAFHPRALLAAGLMAFNPWSIQYSRAGFEVTLLLFLLLSGLWLFMRSLSGGKFLWLSMLCFVLTPWVYSTAKLFTPLLVLTLIFIWRKQILSFPRKQILSAVLSLIVVGFPIAYSTAFGGGAERFGYISVFTDPTTEPEVGVLRETDAKVRGEVRLGLTPSMSDRIFHNKYTFWGKKIFDNYLKTFSTDFLFIQGDPNLRHSIGSGEFYKIEALALIFGLIFFFTGKSDPRVKTLIIFWLLAGVIPSAITRDGGNHATRLILILPPLIFLIAYGVREIARFNKLLLIVFMGIWLLEFVLYMHKYYVHYPWDSERWWHAGYKEAFQSVKQIDKGYDKVIISMAGEPAWIFFAAYYQYSPRDWQNNFPIGKDIEINGFGKVSHIDKYNFGTFNVPGKGIYDLGGYLDSKTLYLAVAKEVGVNLVKEPERTPSNLNLLKSVTYPSGEPAYYLFTGK